MLIGIIIGVCAMSALTTVCYCLGWLDDNCAPKELIATGPVACIAFIMCFIVGRIYKGLYMRNIHKHYNKYNLYRDYSTEGRPVYLDTYFIHVDLARQFYTRADNAEGFIELCGSGKDCKNPPQKAYIISKRRSKKYPYPKDLLPAIRPYTDFYWKIEKGA